MLSYLRHFALVASMLILSAGCGDNVRRSLEITTPPATSTICNDINDTLDGVQVDVQVAASGFSTNEMILLTVDGVRDTQTAQSVPSSGAVTFAGVTLTDGTHALWAESEDGSIRSDTVVVTIDGSGPSLVFANPFDNQTLGAGDDKNSATVAVEFDVQVITDLPDGAEVGFTVTPPNGPPRSTLSSIVQGGQAVEEILFDDRGTWTIEVEALDECLNKQTATIQVFVTVDAPPCAVAISPLPLDVPNLVANVLNAAMDMSPSPGFQATVRVTGNPGDQLTLLVNSVPEAVKIADTNGLASWAVDLSEGMQVIQARCEDGGGNVAFSAPETPLVDTVAPTCTILPPIVDGYNLTPAADEDTSTPATDFTVAVDIGGGDVDGEPVTITVRLTSLLATVSGGSASVSANLASPQNGIPVSVVGNDHALNSCTSNVSINYVTQGCPITWISPLSTVITDADTNTSGFQADVTIEVDPACAGRDVTLLNCDIGGPLVVTSTGSPARATFTVTACATDTCEATRNCTAEVTNAASITTSVDAPLTVDNIAPPVVMAVVNPSVGCGSTITPADDVSPAPGIQVQARLFSVLNFTSRWYEVDGGPPILADASGFADLTLSTGANSIVAYVTDTTTLTGASSPCTITLATLAVSIDTPLDGQTLGPSDGTVNGTDLLVDVCGTVGEVGALVTVDISVDGGAAQSATVDVAGNWCVLGVVLGNGPHSIVADGFNGANGNLGSATINVSIDLVPPDDPSDFAGTITGRASVNVAYTEPGDGGATVARCEIRSSLAIITNGNWTSATVEVSLPGAGTGTAQSFNVNLLRLGPPNTWHLAARCEDTAGNLSNTIDSGPHVLAFTEGPELVPVAVPGGVGTNHALGTSIVGGDLNNDGFSDVIVSAPLYDRGNGNFGDGAVYIYMGSSTGTGTDPDFVIRATAIDSWMGTGVTVLDWNGDNVDDLAVGSPGVNGLGGAVFIFLGSGLGFTPAIMTTHMQSSDADIVIDSDGSGWFVGAGLGWSIERVDFDGDNQDDLLIGVPGAEGFHGGALVLFGGSPLGNIRFPSAMNGAKAYRFMFSSTNCTAGFCAGYGTYAFSLGRLGDGGADTRDDVFIGGAADNVDGATAILSEDRSFVFYGRPQPGGSLVDVPYTAAEEQIVGELEGNGKNQFGSSAASIADINGDGKREIVVGASRVGANAGRVYVLPGGTTTVGSSITQNVGSAAFATISGGSNERFGEAIASVGSNGGGSVEGDALQDLVIANSVGPRIWVFFVDPGFSGSLTTTNAADSIAGPTGFTFAKSAAWVGDVNMDGLDDIAWGAFDATDTTDPGSFQILY